MALEMVLNEHSLRAPDVDRARVWMTTLAETIQQASQICGGQAVKLWTQKKVSDTILTTDYSNQDYALRTYLFRDQTLKNNKEQKAQRDYLQSLLTRTPYWDEQPEPRASQNPDIDEIEFNHNNQTCVMCGLGFTYLRGALAVSLPSDPRWQVDNITLKIIWTTSNSRLAQLVEVVEEITHASNPNHVTAHTEWIEKRFRSKIHNGNDLWNNKDSLFPSLIFCDTVHRRIRRLSGQIFESVLERLSDLQTHCEGWTSGSFNTEGLLGKPRPESPATLQMFGQHRNFRCPDGEERIFSWHINLTDSWRLHFFPGPEPGKMIIGYIGPHLPTVQHR